MLKAEDVIKLFFEKKSFKISEKKNQTINQWKNIAGKEIARHSELLEIENETLIIEIDHPGVQQLIKIKQKEILRNILKKYPNLSIKRLRTSLCRIKEERVDEPLIKKKEYFYKKLENINNLTNK